MRRGSLCWMVLLWLRVGVVSAIDGGSEADAVASGPPDSYDY